MCKYISQRKTRYNCLMLIVLHRGRKSTKINRIIAIHMGITIKPISNKFLNIIIRTNHWQTEIVMRYGGLRSSVTCVTTSCSSDSFASPTHRTNISWIFFHSCTSASRSSCSVSDGFWLSRTRRPGSSHKYPIGYKSGDNACQGRSRVWYWFRKFWKRDPRDTLHCHVERRDQSFAVAQRAER